MREELELKFLINRLTKTVGTVGYQLYFGDFLFNIFLNVKISWRRACTYLGTSLSAALLTINKIYGPSPAPAI
jgi:hypothetical protein